MTKRAGSFHKQKIAGESYETFIPAPLPPKPAIALESLSSQLEKATAALSELKTITTTIPNTSLFLYMYVRKEALLSSQIEGTQSSFSDLILFENEKKPRVTVDDVEEVSNYVKAIRYALKRLRDGFPLCLRLLKETHAVLLKGVRGESKLPGEFRRTQNWIGGTRPGNALFVPPSADHLPECLKNLEAFLHNEDFPVLIKAALAHLQFETIHPFLDGNGRLGRLLITILLIEGGLLDEPILYFSLYLKQKRDVYYQLLQEVRTHGTWETWVEFFLEGIESSSKQAIKTTNEITSLFNGDAQRIASLGRARFTCENALEHMKKVPQVAVPELAAILNISAPAARLALENMEKLNIVTEITKKERNKLYVYKKYLALLEEGADPF